MSQPGCLASTTAGHSFTLFIFAINKMNIPHQEYLVLQRQEFPEAPIGGWDFLENLIEPHLSHIILEPSVQMESWDPEKLNKLSNVTQLFSASAPTPPGAPSDPQHDVEGHAGSGACPSLKCHPLLLHPTPPPFLNDLQSLTWPRL